MSPGDTGPCVFLVGVFFTFSDLPILLTFCILLNYAVYHAVYHATVTMNCLNWFKRDPFGQQTSIPMHFSLECGEQLDRMRWALCAGVCR